MKLMNLLGIAALVAFAIGCSTTKQMENQLAAAGFTAQPAVTPEQQAHLKTIPAGKVTMVVRDGKPYYVYPDVAKQVLYVGQSAQYDAYQKLRAEEQMSAEQATAAMDPETGWAIWGGWGGYMGVPVMRR